MSTVPTFYTIPINSRLPNQKFKISLSGSVFTIELAYNVRQDRWIMSISDASGNQILVGVPILINRNLTGQYRTLKIPTGIIFATDDSSQGQQPTLNSWNIDHTLGYVENLT